MMHAYRLVRLIETHADGLANGLQKKIDASDRVPDYHSKVPREELTRVVNEIYQNLGQWLLAKTESDIESRYIKIGMRRAEQGVPVAGRHVTRWTNAARLTAGAILIAHRARARMHRVWGR